MMVYCFLLFLHPDLLGLGFQPISEIIGWIFLEFYLETCFSPFPGSFNL